MYLLIQCLVLVALVSFTYSRYLPDHITNHSASVEEIQHAICTIDTKDVKASANATITRQLKGVCTSKELNFRLDQLEKRLVHDINLIKSALHIDNVPIPQDDFHTKALNNADYRHEVYDYDYVNAIESIKSEETHNSQTLVYKSLQPTTMQGINNAVNEEITPTPTTAEVLTSTPTLKNLKNAYKRDLEATKNNGTIQIAELGNSYLYYWKIYDIKEIFQFSDTHIDSPIFYLLGNPLHIQFSPNHLGTRYAALELLNEHNVVFKHRFTILNQVNEQADLSSQILGKHAALFRIANERLFKEEFTVDGSLMIKAMIALRAK